MVRSMVGFAGFAVVVLIAIRLLGMVFGILGTVLWFAFLGFVFYTLLRIFFPNAADRIREMIRGKPAAAD